MPFNDGWQVPTPFQHLPFLPARHFPFATLQPLWNTLPPCCCNLFFRGGWALFYVPQTQCTRRYRSPQAVPSGPPSYATCRYRASACNCEVLWTQPCSPRPVSWMWRMPNRSVRQPIPARRSCCAWCWADCCFVSLVRFSFFAPKLKSVVNIAVIVLTHSLPLTCDNGNSK